MAETLRGSAAEELTTPRPIHARLLPCNSCGFVIVRLVFFSISPAPWLEFAEVMVHWNVFIAQLAKSQGGPLAQQLHLGHSSFYPPLRTFVTRSCVRISPSVPHRRLRERFAGGHLARAVIWMSLASLALRPSLKITCSSRRMRPPIGSQLPTTTILVFCWLTTSKRAGGWHVSAPLEPCHRGSSIGVLRVEP